MANWKKLAQGAAGAAGGAGLNVEDVFSTYLFVGNGSTQTITNGIDFSNEGGLLWLKARNASNSHTLFDTERAITQILSSNSSTNTTNSTGWGLTSFNSDGFSLNATSMLAVNNSGNTMCSWSFRKAPKFFDVVTYTGNGISGRTVSHSLGSVPACIFIKRTSSNEDWVVYHVGADATSPEDYYIKLNSAFGRIDSTAAFNDTAPTSTNFTVGNNGDVNGNGDTYVAYLFAHNDGDGNFGPTGDQDIIKCGSYTGNGENTNGKFIDLGFEPQWLLIRRLDDFSDWHMFDTMRGIANYSGGVKELIANGSGSEGNVSLKALINPTGFTVSQAQTNSSFTQYIYIAIRRGTKLPETGTDVFAMDQDKASGSVHSSGFPVDMAIWTRRSSTNNRWMTIRHTMNQDLRADTADEEGSFSFLNLDENEGAVSKVSSPNICYMWKRAEGYFDVVSYRGTGSNTQSHKHALNAVPEMMWVKNRSIGDSNWMVYHKDIGNSKYLHLNTSNAQGNTTTSLGWGNTTPTSTDFYVGADVNVGGSGDKYINLLFATFDGVSKVGSYTGSGSTQTINCGFSNGARFVLLKRYDSSADWILFDTERGILSGNDPFFILNTNNSEFQNADHIDAASSGFILNGSNTAINASNANYIFYAIA